MTRVITIIVAIAVAAGAVLAVSGVLHFQNTKDQSTMTLDKKELKEKTNGAVKKVEKIEKNVLQR